MAIDGRYQPVMAATQHVTLTELLEVQDEAISEISGWSLLCQSTVTLLESNKSMINNYSFAASASTQPARTHTHTLARVHTIQIVKM